MAMAAEIPTPPLRAPRQKLAVPVMLMPKLPFMEVPEQLVAFRADRPMPRPELVPRQLLAFAMTVMPAAVVLLPMQLSAFPSAAKPVLVELMPVQLMALPAVIPESFTAIPLELLISARGP